MRDVSTPRSDMDAARQFDEGVRLFNAGRWYDAHEAWEELWHALADDERRPFVQGLIQCAVSLEHVRRGNPRGALTMFERARDRLAGAPAVCLGVDARRLVAELEAFLEPLRAMPAEALRPRAGPGLALPIDPDGAPRIAFAPRAGDGLGPGDGVS